MRRGAQTASSNDAPALRRGLRPGDAEAIRAVTAATGFFNDEEIGVAEELALEHLERGEASGYDFVVAESGGALLGFGCFGRIPLTASSYDLYWLVVAPQAQGRGTGRMLLEAVEDAVRRVGGERLYAETSGREQYQPTCAFYERVGFELEACLADFYASGDDKLIYRKKV